MASLTQCTCDASLSDCLTDVNALLTFVNPQLKVSDQRFARQYADIADRRSQQSQHASSTTQTQVSLCSSDKFIELEIPPDFGNGAANAGIPLARLLWHVPAQGLMTLLAGLLLERRVILVAPSTDMVSAAVHAAAALLYPFTWQHIYLPLLPMSLKVGICISPTAMPLLLSHLPL